jgi:hypothetical protein
MAVASNAPFSEWQKTFTDPRLCNAVVDRLTLQSPHHRDRHRVLPAAQHHQRARLAIISQLNSARRRRPHRGSPQEKW